MDLKDLNPKTFIANHLDGIANETENIAKSTAADLAKIKEQTKIDPDLL